MTSTAGPKPGIENRARRAHEAEATMLSGKKTVAPEFFRTAVRLRKDDKRKWC
jgi:hypothetical protein